MCKWGTYANVNVIRRANPFVKDGWHEVKYIDSCIASIVQKMNDQGIITEQSCCGHFESRGYIWISHESIHDARKLGYLVEMVDFSTDPGAQRVDGKPNNDYRIEPYIWVDSISSDLSK